MNASLDTNVIIHLYNASFQYLLFDRFEKLKVYEFIRNTEMEHHAPDEVIKLFDKDVADGKIEIITDEYFKSIGMYYVFKQHVNENKILYDIGDLGEVYAIALAETLGCITIVTDDIKEYGPHFMLMRIPDSDVMPFAFYELLFLNFLEGIITEDELDSQFGVISSISGLKMNFSSKMRDFIKRFWSDPYTDSERKWMESFCTENNINAKQKLLKLSSYLKSK